MRIKVGDRVNTPSGSGLVDRIHYPHKRLIKDRWIEEFDSETMTTYATEVIVKLDRGGSFMGPIGHNITLEG